MLRPKLSFKSQISLIFIVLLAICISVVGYLIISTIKGSIEKDVFNQQSNMAKAVKMNVADFINDSKQVVSFSATTPEVKDMSAISQISTEYKGVPENADVQKRQMAKNLLQQYKNFAYFESFTPDKGINIMLEPYKYQTGLPRMDYAFRDWFKGATSTMQTYVSEVYMSASINKPVVAISTPITDDQNKLTGVWLGTLTLDTLSQKVQDLQFGKTGKIYLVDKNGNLIAHPNKELTKNIKQLKNDPIVTRLMKGESGTGYFKEPIDNTYVLATYMPVGINGWGVVVEESTSEAFASITQAIQRAIIITILVILLAALVIMIYSKRIGKPIQDIARAATQVAQGDLNVEVQDCRSNQDMEDLTKSIKLMLNHLKTLIQAVMKDEEVVNLSAKQLAASTQQTSVSSTEIASTLNQISSTVENVSSRTQSVATHSSNVIDLANSGKSVINGVIEQMNNINESSSAASAVVLTLAEASSQIGQIVDLINQIAEQTNLLALNAAIEAARAGEHGKGFAVVAEEVRGLAEQSAQATKKIYELLTKVQNESNKAVASINENTAVVQKGITAASEADTSFEKIHNVLEKLNEEITDVAAASQEISAGIQNIAGAIEEQTATTEEITASSESLVSVAHELRESVSKFTVE